MPELTRRMALKYALISAAVVGLVNVGDAGVAQAHHRANHGKGGTPTPTPTPTFAPEAPVLSVVFT